jgi:dTDP-4-dehydrorhamnose reductase
MQKIGITGHRSPMGQELLKYPNTFPLEMDIRNSEQVEMVIKSERPDLVLHLACISGVDECEKPENEKKVIETNLRGTFHVTDAAYKYGCGVVLLSTDHVFDGIWGNYKESAKPYPKNFYGHSKAAAEGLRTAFSNLKIVRTSRLFSNLTLDKEMGKLISGEVQTYPAFMYRSFMWLHHFTSSLMEYVNLDTRPDVLHISGTQSVSYFTFMKDVAGVFGLNRELIMPRTKELQGCSPRPFKAGLNVSLSKRLGLNQYSYLDGLNGMKNA